MCISNILKAIESGIYSESVKNRLASLESERAKPDQQLHEAKRKVVPVTREGVLAYLRILQHGDVLDRDFQRELFKNFLVSVYVYDDNRLKIVFSCMGSENSTEIPLGIENTPPNGGVSESKEVFVLGLDRATTTPHRFGTMRLFVFVIVILLQKAPGQYYQPGA